MTRWGELAEVRARRADLAHRIKCLKPRSFKRRALEALAVELTSHELQLTQMPSPILLPAPRAPEAPAAVVEAPADEPPAQGDLYGGRRPYWVDQ